MTTQQRELGLAEGTQKADAVECLGLTFGSDLERRAHFTQLLREKLQDPEFRDLPGFPKADDEAILRMSDPPYYTACPNPFIADYLATRETSHPADETYSREPFASDVAVGKTNPVYTAHSYHTKVPPDAIAKYIQHYTEPGDVVLDCYCGTGMTGVAAIRGSRDATNPQPRVPILADLAPAATFIASAYTQWFDVREYQAAIKSVVSDVLKAHGEMLQTRHTGTRKQKGTLAVEPQLRSTSVPGTIDYTIWSDVLSCPECAAEFSYWSVALDKAAGRALRDFSCPSCSVDLNKRSAPKARENYFDPVLRTARVRAKRVLVMIVYSHSGSTYEKTPDAEDTRRLNVIEQTALADWVPSDRMMHTEGRWGDQWRDGYHFDVEYAHDFYTPRNLRILGALLGAIRKADVSESTRRALLFTFTGMNRAVSKLASIAFSYYFKGGGGAVNAGTKGTLYLSSCIPEVNPLRSFETRAKSILRAAATVRGARFISTNSAECLPIPDESVDYAFVDPPFGDNLAYSELNFLWESWLGVHTNAKNEAIVSRHQEKGVDDFRDMIRGGFTEVFRVLRPGRWLTVEFHNSSNILWNAIQEAIGLAGFVVADVSVLDKKQGSYNQYVARKSVNKDLVISAYKPSSQLTEGFELSSSGPDVLWAFVAEHLRNLPLVAGDGRELTVNPERLPTLLFDRTIAFFVQRRASVPITASEFYVGLAQRFPERDGMYFLSQQVAEYDRRRARVAELKQLSLFVNDEASALRWLRQALGSKPRGFQELQPEFMHQVQVWSKHERPLELQVLLSQNFLRYDGRGPVPSQIHGYLSSNFKDLRNLDKEDPQLKEKATDRWYVPDPNKQADLEQLRDRALLREFEEYKTSTQRKLKVFRAEAVRAGFKSAWQGRDYGVIVKVAEKLPSDVLQEDATLLMYYDNALTRLGDE